MSFDNWRPSATIERLQARAKILQQIREFFAQRNVMEVDTPLLAHGGTTDPYIESFTTCFQAIESSQTTDKLYLQTSPEFAMKRLLAAGSGSIYQIGKSFRNGEVGRHHNPEFTMLEWYRLNFDLSQMIAEVIELISPVLAIKKVEYFTYEAVFTRYCDLNPHIASSAEILTCAKHFELYPVKGVADDDRDNWLQLLMTHVVEPRLDKAKITVIYDYPLAQAALAKIRYTDQPVAERFEVYVNGLELANGYHELTDFAEQQRRFKQDAEQRSLLKRGAVTPDEYYLAALKHGLPDCSGVALGVDRLVMLALNCKEIAEIYSFSYDRV